MERWAPLAVIVAMAVAGCGGRDAVPAGVPVDADGSALPNLEGFVVDDAIRPMEGVLVRILFSDVNATTDAQGHYAIHQPTFLAEDVLLSAAAPGYQPRTQQVQLSGHRSTRMDFRLEPDPYQSPRIEVLSQTIGLGCQVTLALGPLPGARCDPPSTDSLLPVPQTKVWPIDTTVGLAGAVLDIHWDPQTDLSERLHATLRGPVAGCCAGGSDQVGSKGEVHADVTGSSPLRLELPEEAARAFPRWTALWLEVRLPESQGTPPLSFSLSQSVDAYATLFYVDPAPPGYTLA